MLQYQQILEYKLLSYITKKHAYVILTPLNPTFI